MLPAELQRPEGARYGASLVLVPGLWAGPAAWRACAGYLAHRGWESRLLDLRAAPGGTAARGEAVAEVVAALGGPAVLVAHGAGAAVALAAARRGGVAGIVLVAPLVPGSRGARAVTLGLDAALPLLFGRPVPPPRGHRAALLLGPLPAAVAGTVHAALAPEAAAAVWETARGGAPLAADVPVLVVHGGRDALLSPEERAALVARLRADEEVLPEAGPWPLAGPGWQDLVNVVHRWVVRRLGEPLLELYPEAMAAREEDDEA